MKWIKFIQFSASLNPCKCRKARRVSLLDWKIHNRQVYQVIENPFYSYNVLYWLSYDMSSLWNLELEANGVDPVTTGSGARNLSYSRWPGATRQVQMEHVDNDIVGDEC